MNIEALYKVYQENPSVQTDTRKLQKGDLFFALKGPSFNGNAFAKKAIESGAAYAVIDEAGYEIPGKTFLVADVLTALQELATYHRKGFPFPVLAITGSNGKTTTKELIHAVLSTTYKTYTTEGNLNNHIGVPLTLLKIKADAEIAVIEMGANHLHEIESYCRIANPTHGIITNCGKAHLEGFGSLEGVRKGKGELYDHLRNKRDGVAFVMWDYDYLREMCKGISKIITYGTHDAVITGNAIKGHSLLTVTINEGTVQESINTQLVGGYNLPNVLAAVAVGGYMNIPLEKIITAIEKYHPSNSRSQLIEQGSNKIILDAYNANPSSMKLAIENIANMGGVHKILLLGGMAEMGAESAHEHEEIVALIKKHKWDHVALVGKQFKPYSDQFHYFNDAAAAAQWFQNQHFTNATVLIKGSRSTQMEKILSL